MPNQGISQERFYECQIEKTRTILDRADFDRELSVPNYQTAVSRFKNGIVNLTRIWQNGQHENQNTQVPRFSFSLRNYQSRRLALLSILPQSP